MPKLAGEQEPFLAKDLEGELARFDRENEAILPTEDDIRDALSQAGRVLSATVLTQRREIIFHTKDHRYRLDPHSSQENHTQGLVMFGFDSLMADHEYAAYRGMAALVIGHAGAAGDEVALKHGFEFGKRVIAQRANFGAVALTAACLYSRLYNPLFDDEAGGGTLVERTEKAYKSRAQSPLYRVPKPDGKRMDDLVTRLDESDFAGVKPKLKPKTDTRLGRIGYIFRVGRTATDIRLRSRNPALVAEAMEEAFDTFLTPTSFELDASDLSFIARFTSVLNRYFQGAAQRDEAIAHDPRPMLLNLLTNRLSAFSLSKETAALSKDVKQVALREKAFVE